jgi:hypothetical protein
MTYQKADPNPARQPYRDLNDKMERTTTDPDRPRRRWGMGVTDPAAKSTNPGVRAWWGIGALLAVMFVVAAAIALWNYRTHTSPTATGPSTTQSAPSSTGQGGAANTGAAR